MAGNIELTRKFNGECTICRTVPTEITERDRIVLPMFRAVGVDVNWGEDLNICTVCAGVMADLLGRVDKEKYAKVAMGNGKLQERLAEVETELTETKERIKKILEGRKAEKRQKEVVNG